jgi:hypothetical protein
LLVPEGWAPCPRLLPEWYSEAFVHADLFAGGTGERVSLALRVEATRRLAVEGGNERPVVWTDLIREDVNNLGDRSMDTMRAAWEDLAEGKGFRSFSRSRGFRSVLSRSRSRWALEMGFVSQMVKGAKKAKMVEEAFPENEDNEPAFDALMQLQKRWSAPPRPRR